MISLPWFRGRISGYLDLIWHILGHKNGQSGPSSWFSFGFGSAGSGARSPSVVTASKVPPLWALIIGINDYPVASNQAKLSGAVTDADAMSQYIRTELGVPERQIRNLRNGQATRAAIIAAFERLRDNPEIKKGDPILIYYAGHGGEVPTKGVQTLVPFDYIPEKTPPIPDRTVATLINAIARKHGNNITVILDCCHSGSGARGDEDEGVSVRGGQLHPNDAPDGLDARIYAENPSRQATGGTRGLRVAKGFANQDMNSHVLLAACSSDELAREDNKKGVARGRFTGALLELFKTVSPDQITYFEVLTRMPAIEGQNPQVEGFFQKRIFFDAKVIPPSRYSYALNLVKESKKEKYILEAGRAHGITDGAEFTIFQSKESFPDSPLGVMVANDKKIKGFTTELEAVGAAPKPFQGTAVAIQTKAGASEDLKIHVPLENRYLPVFEAIAKEMDGTGPELCRLKLVEDRKDAKLGIVAQKGQIAFDVLEQRARDHNFTRIPFTIDCVVDDIHRVIRAASHYHFHLNVDKPNSEIKKGIKIECFALEEQEDDDGQDVLVPTGQNLHKAGKMEVVVDEDSKYGMRITNDTPWDLHFACFFFDHVDLSITALTEMSAKTSYKKDAPLPKGGKTAEMGFGRLGIPPFECEIPDGLDLALGFLKFYFTVEPVDLSHIPQVTPFTKTRGVKLAIDRKDVWGTVLIPVVLKRG